MSIFTKDDYLKEHKKWFKPKHGKYGKGHPLYKTKSKLPTQLRTTTYLTWCPRDCTQNKRGKRQKKTFHRIKKICLNCGFKLGR